MGTYSHLPSSDNGPQYMTRPPVPPRRCEVETETTYGDEVIVRVCGAVALWVIPEVAACHHHLPHHLIPIADARRAMWRDYAAELWGDILAETPVPDD
jgi:hypothetical protein